MAGTQKRTRKPAVELAGIEELGIPAYKVKRGEKYMSPGMLEHFKTVLTTWKEQLMEEVDRTVDHMKDDTGNLPDPADRATQEEEFSLELRTRDRERQLIRKIEESLNAMTDSSYGFCESCGAEIGIQRLEARPTANLCIECKTIQEMRERQ